MNTKSTVVYNGIMNKLLRWYPCVKFCVCSLRAVAKLAIKNARRAASGVPLQLARLRGASALYVAHCAPFRLCSEALAFQKYLGFSQLAYVLRAASLRAQFFSNGSSNGTSGAHGL